MFKIDFDKIKNEQSDGKTILAMLSVILLVFMFVFFIGVLTFQVSGYFALTFPALAVWYLYKNGYLTVDHEERDL